MKGSGRGRAFDYQQATHTLVDLFAQAEGDFAQQKAPQAPAAVVAATAILFASKTQSYREVALGCALVRLLDKDANIRLPYANQGPHAFNGRTLDEQVINPFLHERQIPASKGPYLATFRRSVKFDEGTRSGTRDKLGYDAFLAILSELESSANDMDLRAILRYLLYHFIALRNASQIVLARINRLSLEQLGRLAGRLLAYPSGGLAPLLLTVAMLQTVQQCYGLSWDVRWQGINAADKATGAGGDITVVSAGTVRMVFEVTERQIDRPRVVSTFNTKISPAAIANYIFVFTISAPTTEARQFAAQLFAQGHDIDFVELRPWLHDNLAMVGADCRSVFLHQVLDLLGQPDVPAALKVHWNNLVAELVV